MSKAAASWRRPFAGRKPLMGCRQHALVASLAAPENLFQLRKKLGDDVLHRPRSAVSQPANGRSRNDADGAADFVEDLEIVDPSLAVSHAIHHLQHPPRSFPTRSALPTRLV